MRQLNVSRHLRRSLCLLASFACLVSTGLLAQHDAAARPAESELDRLMRESGLNDQIAALPDLIVQQATLAAQEQFVPPDFIPHLESLLRSTHSAETLGAVIRSTMPSRMSIDDAVSVLGWLESPLGRRITSLETAAATAEGYAQFEALRPDILRTLTPHRKTLIETLAQNIDALDSSVRAAMNYSATLVHALRSHTRQTVIAPSFEDVQEELEVNRANVTATMRPLVRDLLVYSYLDLSDDDLQRYVDFSATPSARRYHAAMTEALESALVTASRRLGERIGS